MTDIELAALMCAKDIRKRMVDEGLIKVDTKKLSNEVLVKITELQGGKLTFDNNYISYFQKLNNDNFVINIANDIKEEDRVITILQGIAIKIFGFNDLTKERIIRFQDYNFIRDLKYKSKEELMAIYLFARELLMPRELYEDSVEDNIGDDNKCDYKKVAIDFNTSYQKVLAREEDFNLK